jgi:hypothetical protein
MEVEGVWSMLQKDKVKSAAAKPKAAAAKDSKRVTKTTAAKATARTGPRRPAARLSGDLQQRIQQRAYELWENEGRPQGREQAHWQQAERELAGRGVSDPA